ncbi:MAG: serine hydrolase domain-containing protein [Bacteroidales bacterium]|jgi:CubicO group peptidase (beta-lactamase class C family)|nr:serine hydrolase domain-containing protein [Bacteroidales bacterium]
MKFLKQETLNKIVAQTAKNKNVHGSVFHIESGDKSMSFFSASGDISPESQYYIASINKLIISFITLRLCQNKNINLDDKLSNYLPNEILNGLLVHNGKDYAGDLTIRHLISHTSGLPCYLIDKRPDGKKNMDLILNGNDESWPLEKVGREVKKMKSKFIPGTKGKASYSETNFRLLDRVLEIVTQKSIQDLLTDVFQELEMKNTFVLPSNSADNCAPIYFKQNHIDIKEYWRSTHHDIASTAADQMKFIRAFFDGKYFTKEFINELKKWNNIFFPFKYGVGIQKFYIPRLLSPFKTVPELIGHCGSVGSVAFYVPDKEVYITGTVNQTSNPNIVFQTMIKIVNRL